MQRPSAASIPEFQVQHSNGGASQDGVDGSTASITPPEIEPEMLRVPNVGNSLFAVTFSTSLKTLLGTKVCFEIVDSRVVRDPALPYLSLRWKTRSERINRREQVVTLKSAV